MPRIVSARPLSNLNISLHATLTALLLIALGGYALTLLASQPLEMVCGAVIVWRSRGGV